MSGNQRWPWSVLGMDPKGADRRGIKRAYAKKLKLIDPQEDPQRFQDLRGAYEQALQWTQNSIPAAPVVADPPPAPPPDAPEIQPPPQVPAPPEEQPKPKPKKVALPPVHNAPEYETKPRPNTFVDLVSESQALFTQRDLRPEVWRLILNRLVDLDFNQARQYEKELLLGFDSHLFSDGQRPRHIIKRPWLELLDARFGWFSHGLDFQRAHPEHFKVWSYLNDIYRPPLTARQVQRASRKADLGRDPKVPFYLRWWFLLLGYFFLMVWAT